MLNKLGKQILKFEWLKDSLQSFLYEVHLVLLSLKRIKAENVMLSEIIKSISVYFFEFEPQHFLSLG